jgi:hypothetical protein
MYINYIVGYYKVRVPSVWVESRGTKRYCMRYVSTLHYHPFNDLLDAFLFGQRQKPT